MTREEMRLVAILLESTSDSSNADPAFTKNGFSNWRNAMEKKQAFQKHESSDSHMEKTRVFE